MTFLRTAFWLSLTVCPALLASGHTAVAAESGIPVAIADFDNYDTAGESAERTAQYAARVQGFSGLIGKGLETDGTFRVVKLACPEPPCSAGEMAPDELISAARQAGARLLVYGGIHKMSTLIQMGKVQAVDLQEDKLLLDQAISFRGDNDAAFAHAAQFVVDYLEDVAPKE